MSSNVRSVIEKQLEMGKNIFRNQSRTADTPYTTLYHGDIWMKNIMIKRGMTNLCHGNRASIECYFA